MAKSKEQLPVTQSGGLVVPDFMQAETETGLSLLEAYIRPPRLKIVQKTAQPPYSEMFFTGDVVAVPNMSIVAPMRKTDNGRPDMCGESFWVVPLYFFPEFIVWNPIETKGTLDAIRARTTDPKSDIAKRCSHSSTWTAPCPEIPTKDGKQLHIRYVEHLNYVFRLVGDHPMTGIVAVASYSRGQHKGGTALASAIRARSPQVGPKVPCYGCQFEVWSGFERNTKGDWYALQSANPSLESGVAPFVQDADLYASYREEHLKLKQAHLDNAIIVDHDDHEDVDTVSDTAVDEPARRR